jgi:hypothetical protein
MDKLSLGHTLDAKTSIFYDGKEKKNNKFIKPYNQQDNWQLSIDYLITYLYA